MSTFYDKVADRIGKLDADGLRRHYKALTDEIGFYESIFNSIDEGIVALDGNGKVKYANATGNCRCLVWTMAQVARCFRAAGFP